MELFSRDTFDYSVKRHSVADVVNYNELLAVEALNDLLDRDDSLCRCSLCIEDTYALTLNALPPRYIQAQSRDKYRESPAFVTPEQVLEAAVLAAERVKQNPNHS